jgi:tetratricopeptide (TPR) repeat protein
MREKSKATLTTLKQETKSPAKAASDPARDQTAAFEKATAAFHKGVFVRAKELFQEAAGGPSAELAHSAQMYVKMCDRRSGEGAKVEVKSADDLYTLGISLLNRGDLDGAVAALEKALHQKPNADHCHYALALCAGQRGDPASAANHLRRAIEIQPSNRIAALNDAEFHSIAQHAVIRELLNGERSNAG